MFAGAVPWLPSLRGTALVSAMLVGAYGTDAGLAATALLLMAYAAAAGLQIAAGSAWRWVRGARRRVSDIKLLDDGKMKTFQRATLQIFDMPHHPRRLRQAVRRWREWRLNSDVFSPNRGGARRRAGKTSRTEAAGDGAGARDADERTGGPRPSRSHDVDGAAAFGAQSARDYILIEGTLGFGAEGERFLDDGAFDDPPDARLSDGFASARAALASCDVCRSLAPEAIAKLAAEHMREVHIAAGEDVFRGRVRDDELAVLVSGAVAVGDFSGAAGFAGATRRETAALDGADAFSDAFFEGGGATVIRDRGVALNSLLDVLEGSEHAHVAARAGGAGSAGIPTRAESPRRAPSAAGGAGGRSGSALAADPSLNPFGDDQLVSAAAEAAAAASKAAAEAANELANEAVLDSFRPSVAGSASAAEKRREPEGDDANEGARPAGPRDAAEASSARASVGRDPRDTASTPRREKRDTSPARSSPTLRVRTSPASRPGAELLAATETRTPSPLGVAALAAAAAAARDKDEARREDGDGDSFEAPSAGGASDLADASASAASDEPEASPSSRANARGGGSPATPTRSAAERADPEGETRGGLERLVTARDSVSRPGTPGRGTPRSGGGSGFGHANFAPPPSSAFAATDFSGGPGGLPRLRARGGEGGCVIAAVPLRAFHRAAGFRVGIQAPAMRLCGGYHALCHYLRAPSELGALWVDPAPTSVSERRAGAALALARLLGAEAARAVDRSALEALLERRGYAPRGPRRGFPSAFGDGDGDDDWDRSGEDEDDEDDGSKCSTAGGPDRSFARSETRGDGGTPRGHAHVSSRAFDETSARRDSRAGSGVGAGTGGFGVGDGSAGRAPSLGRSLGGSASAANSARGGAPVELEAMELAPGEAVRFRSAAAAALLVERGSLEGYAPTPMSSSASTEHTAGLESRAATETGFVFRGARGARRRDDAEALIDDVHRPRSRDARLAAEGHVTRSRTSVPAFTARAGSCVGEFLLLTGQRAAVTLRAGADGAVVAALPHSAAARLARAYPSTYARVATRIARRLRPSLPARAWDRCGARWIPLGAGQTLADRLGAARAAARRRESDRVADHASPHPDGVYVVVTGRVRLAAETETRVGPETGRSGRSRRARARGDAGRSADFDDAFARSAADAAGAASPGTTFLGPGDAVGEEAILRDAVRFAGSASGDRSRGQSLRLSLQRARAVRESQLLWIPSAGLESLATSAPRAFAALAWRMGARAGVARRESSAATTALSHRVGVGRDADGEDDRPGVAKSGSASTRFVNRDENDATGFGPFGGGTVPNAPPRAVAVVPVSEGAALALDEFCAATLAALRKSCAARVADSATRLAEVGQAGVGNPALANEATAHWLASIEAAHDVVLLKADPFPSPWCAQCARHADTILLVASAEDAPPTKEEGRSLQARLLRWDASFGEDEVGLAQRELVLLHASAELAPTGTREWLEAFSVHRHHHLARAPAHGLAPAHASRLARSLRRHSVGLVLAGGGARGFAHVGVLMALEEEGVPVDMLGGTSMGSFVGGVYAKEPTALLTRIIARRLAVHMSSAWEQLLDLTVPVVSYFSGFRMNRALEPLFRGAKIEDCWLPFFCLTLDLISCAPIVHRNGTLWRYVRASMALVGFLPPVCDRPATEATQRRARSRSRTLASSSSASSSTSQMHVLVDGGYVNNLPTDVMRSMGARVVIAVDVSGRGLPETRMRPWGDAISGFGLFLRNVAPSWLGGGPTCPTMAQMQSHLPFVTDYANAARRVGTVDIMVRPAVADVPILAFGRYAEIVRAGHEAGLRAVRAWKLANPEAAPLLDDGLWRPAWGQGAAQGAATTGAAGDRARHSRRSPSQGGGSRWDALDADPEREPRPRRRGGSRSDDGGDSETGSASNAGEERRASTFRALDGKARLHTRAALKPSAERRRGFAEWFLGSVPGDAEDADDAERDADLDAAAPRGSVSGFAGEVFPSRDVSRRGPGTHAAGFFSPDQPAPSMRQRHRYNSYQSGLDGFDHPRS